MKVLKIILYVISIIAIFLIGWFGSKKYYYHPIEPVEIHDTIRIDSVRIVEHCVPLYIKDYDTIVVKNDTTIRDTINVLVPISQYEYKDTIVTDTSRTELDIKYSGYKATLDEININYQSTKEVVLNQKKKHFNWFIGPSLQIGYGMQYDKIQNKISAGPEISVGISVGWGYCK